MVLIWDPPVQRHGAVLGYHIFYKDHDSSRYYLLLIGFSMGKLDEIEKF